MAEISVKEADKEMDAINRMRKKSPWSLTGDPKTREYIAQVNELMKNKSSEL